MFSHNKMEKNFLQFIAFVKSKEKEGSFFHLRLIYVHFKAPIIPSFGFGILKMGLFNV
jgi:hypothetical protein